MNPAHNRRILLVDDTPSIHDDFRKILAHRPAATQLDAAEEALFGQPARPGFDGFALDSAHDGREGVAMAQAAVQAGQAYAMAFVDMRMPGWDGVETIARLWQTDPRLQVVICTAYTDHPWDEVMARLDVRDRLLVVKKPFDMIEVSQLARTLTAKWELAQQAEAQIESLAKAVAGLQASEAALRQSHKELETFAHSLSHDLRAPLAAMGSFTQLLARELEGTAPGKALHYLSRIQANATMGERLIDQLLFLDQVSREQLRIEAVELGALSRTLLEELRSADPHREVTIEVQEGLWASADLGLARIALRHLLDNAWKFSSAAAPLRIALGRQDGPQGEPVFYVRDNGSGFDMAYAGKLFHAFQRLHTDTSVAGTGAGLVIVSRIIGRHGGRIWADANPGGGATFYFTLPARDAAEGKDAADSQAPPANQASPSR